MDVAVFCYLTNWTLFIWLRWNPLITYQFSFDWLILEWQGFSCVLRQNTLSLITHSGTLQPPYCSAPFYLYEPLSISYPPHALGLRCPPPLQPPPFFFIFFFLYWHHPPQPQLPGSSSGQANCLSPRRGGSCHISNLAFPPPDKSYISLYFQPPLSRTLICTDLPFFFALVLYCIKIFTVQFF